VYEQELPGTYDISLGTGTVSPPPEPFVDFDENLTPVSPTGPTNVIAPQVVTANNPTPSTWYYDESDLTSFVPAGALLVAGGTPVSVYNSQIPGTHTLTVIPTGSSATTANLYPYSSEYTSIWYGDCADEQPTNAANYNELQPSEGGTALVSLGGLDDLAYSVTKTSGAPTGLVMGATAQATMADTDSSCANDTVTPVNTGTGGISQTGVVVISTAVSSCSLHTNPVICDSSMSAAYDGEQVVATGLQSNAYVYGASSGSFTLSSSPVASQPITSTATTFALVGETYDVTVTDPYNHADTAMVPLMVNPNGVIKWTAAPAGTFSQYPLTGTAITIPVL
jgi:hypothetical protein